MEKINTVKEIREVMSEKELSQKWLSGMGRFILAFIISTTPIAGAVYHEMGHWLYGNSVGQARFVDFNTVEMTEGSDVMRPLSGPLFSSAVAIAVAYTIQQSVLVC
jgi:hypothetical protein